MEMVAQINIELVNLFISQTLQIALNLLGQHM